mmetsp:Transcript_85288/g.241661  ORF Transcript_85288/g.241661 Transcript_85288/m.241661 type:complete len:324 (+) Transcript_85288:501-1472(+)
MLSSYHHCSRSCLDTLNLLLKTRLSPRPRRGRPCQSQNARSGLTAHLPLHVRMPCQWCRLHRGRAWRQAAEGCQGAHMAPWRMSWGHLLPMHWGVTLVAMAAIWRVRQCLLASTPCTVKCWGRKPALLQSAQRHLPPLLGWSRAGSAGVLAAARRGGAAPGASLAEGHRWRGRHRRSREHRGWRSRLLWRWSPLDRRMVVRRCLPASTACTARCCTEAEGPPAMLESAERALIAKFPSTTSPSPSVPPSHWGLPLAWQPLAAVVPRQQRPRLRSELTKSHGLRLTRSAVCWRRCSGALCSWVAGRGAASTWSAGCWTSCPRRS